MSAAVSVLWEPCAGGARVLRLFGDSPCPAVPDKVGGLPVTEIGPYCFSARRDPEGGKLEIPADVSSSDHPICGEFVEEVTLPDSVRALHNGAFYNCRSLHRLTVGPGLESLGSDLFTNCRSLRTFALRAAPDQPTGLKKMLAAISGGIGVEFCSGAQPARLYYPEYSEYMDENTPAHIFNRGIQGVGYRYRQCFAQGVLAFAEYDAAFSMADAEESPSGLCRVALDRLCTPVQLSEDARVRYGAYLGSHADDALALVLADRDAAALQVLGTVLDPQARREGALSCGGAGWSEGAALLLAGTAGSGHKPKKSYDFDDL